MKIKAAVFLTVLILGVSSLLMCILTGIGLSQRQPAEVVVNQTVCQYLKSKTTVIEREGSCQFRVDDYAKREGLVELRWLDKEIFPAGQSVIIRNSDLLFANKLPKSPIPAWLYFALMVSVFMTVLPIALQAHSLKKA